MTKDMYKLLRQIDEEVEPKVKMPKDLTTWAHKYAKGYISHNIVQVISDWDEDIHDEERDEVKEKAIMKAMKEIAKKIKTFVNTL
jgi:hypothetical protein